MIMTFNDLMYVYGQGSWCTRRRLSILHLVGWSIDRRCFLNPLGDFCLETRIDTMNEERGKAGVLFFGMTRNRRVAMAMMA